MILFPAIDILDGKCVRLKQGDYDEQTIYHESPLEMAKIWKNKGAEFLHIVDLDAARTNEVRNKTLIQSITKQIDIPIQVGGGIRTMKRIKTYLSSGVNRVIIGTAAINNPQFLKEAVTTYKEKIAVSLDARNGFIATEGWEKTSTVKAIDFVKKLEKLGVRTIIYTDIAKDGMLQGPNFKELQEINEKTSMDVIASGGVTSKKDIQALQQMNLYGAIIGKALYDGNLELEAALEVTSNEN
ncbi:1-(5-phosphoribosyl)-5-[(5-phosphoribosylamino)methylideneamino]imidazole-4-carboxamide isomerase [Cerasibacillus terrae]|uniref:1-(5-phosphoribosyl)-5-[(5-phosphoribosylamino)methylideneamino] imidazole-4-carboxamide isomerase n=1 Tax=Cerasibacillus terrae TaxID=2498845 RepID=A0A5C8NXH6_9BACI|nr:1-(5-phosphoribosyl)-5-[(5-phosphoribosylamino)methylideneamino]imidazole-4-carboxamide isomerase [Cerasibacillus terrae]TXL65824.1 1-(5-phosphoribosyl)-5-[(5-phosphoribosylamino)methylideneamino]imidazole-4-carboxamide isomerase [Cerasibacillus terrae]